jgi:NTE family protein
MKKALVISGGGSKGAFAVGALTHIHKHVLPLDQFDIYCGTSTGSLITPFAILGQAGLDLLTELYTKSKTEDIITTGAVGDLLGEVSLFSALPLKNLINNTLLAAHIPKILAKSLFLSTVCLQTEKLTFFSTKNAPSTQDYEVIQISTEADIQRAMLASACQPVFTEPIIVQPTKPHLQYVDGGVRETTPLQVAVDAGATSIIVISLSPANTPPTNSTFGSAFGILLRTIDMYGEDVSHNDYRVPLLYESANGFLESLRANLKTEGLSDATIDALIETNDNPFRGKPIKKIIAIRPNAPLTEGGQGGLVFEKNALKQMFDKGLAKAKEVFPLGAPPVDFV